MSLTLLNNVWMSVAPFGNVTNWSANSLGLGVIG